MVKWMVSSSVLLAVVILLRSLLRGKTTLCFQYALWGLVLIRLLVPVSFGVSPVSVMNVVPDVLSKTVVSEKRQVDTPISPGLMMPEPLPPGSPESADALEKPHYETNHVDAVVVDWKAALKVVWLTGLSVIGLFLLVTNLRFSIRLKKDRCMTNISEYPLSVYVSSLVETPCIFGLFNPAIYITQEVYQDLAVLHHVLEHETTHYYHADHIWSILRGVCLALHWYNLLVWFAASLSMEDAELACDESTINRMGEESRVGYGRSLIGLTSKRRSTDTLFTSATTMNSSKNSIQKRITLISKKQRMAPCTLVLAVFIVLLTACSTFTGEKDVLSKKPSSGSKVAESGIKCYDISLNNAPLYGSAEISTEPPIDDSDILEVLAEAKSDGVKMLFYRARGGDI